MEAESTRRRGHPRPTNKNPPPRGGARDPVYRWLGIPAAIQSEVLAPIGLALAVIVTVHVLMTSATGASGAPGRGPGSTGRRRARRLTRLMPNIT
jgi:hypothetical protein